MSTTTTGTHTPTQSQGAGHVYSLDLEGLVEDTEDTAGRRRIPTGSPQFSVQPRYVDDDARPTTELATYTRQPGSARWPVAPPSQFPVSPTYRIHNLPPRPSRIPTQPPPSSLPPPQLYNVNLEHPGGSRAPATGPPHSSLRIGRKKALLPKIGIDYSKHRDRQLRLRWGVYDAKEMARFLQEHHDFQLNDIQILTDDQRKNLPTAANILAGMRWLVEGTQPGDSLFFYFSGHSTQIEDQDGDELDGFDECMCAMDYDDRKNPPKGIIVDDTMHDIMVKPLPRGCRLTAVLDCCNSGTLLDLPYIYDSNGVLKLNRPDIVQWKKTDAVVISLSTCQDSSRAYEVRGGGALREAFIEYMKRSGNRGTYLQVIQSLRSHMAANGLSQFPQLSSSHRIDTDQQFIITDSEGTLSRN